MARSVTYCVSSACCLLALGGCYGRAVVHPESDERSAIEYSNRMLKEMSTGMDRVLSPALSSTTDEDGYRVFKGHAYVETDATVMNNFLKFCASLGATMGGRAGNVCQQGERDEDIKFVVRSTSESVPAEIGSDYQKVKVTLEVLEPVGKASAPFLQAIRPDGYVPQVEREAADAANEERQRQQDAAAEKMQSERAIASEAERKRDAEAQRENQLAAETRERQLKAETAKFRSLLKTEDETNCGPTIEIKGNLVKVYHTVENYGNEHWVQKRRLFPPGYGCSFYNGVYQPPYAF